MSFHEAHRRHDEVEPGSDRAFGLTVGAVLLAIGGYHFFTGSPAALWFMIPGAALIALGALLPRTLHPLNVAWTKLGLLLGRVVTPVVMLFVYVLSVVPAGLLLRAFGKDLLRLEPDPGSPSYWIDRVPPGPPPDSLKDQF